jgi:DNA-binding beta-propeller fold protein YncE
MPRRFLLALVFAVLAGAPAASAAPMLPTSRPADPAGRLTPLQAFPTGVAVSPDGKTVLAIAGAVIQGGAQPPDPLPQIGVQVYVIDAASGLVRQVVKVDDAFQDVVFAPDGSRAYVAGGGAHSVEEIDFDSLGIASAGPSYDVAGFAAALALEPGGKGIWVGEPEKGQVQLVDLGSGHVERTIPVPGGNQLALAPGGGTLYAANWRGSAISAIDLATGSAQTLATGLHPTDVAIDSSGHVIAADANDATLARAAPGDASADLIDIAQIGRRSDSPNALVAGPHGRVYVSLADDDAIAVMAPAHGTLHVAGLIPTGWYPDAIALSPDARTLYAVTARGLAHSVLATNPYVDPDPAMLIPDGAYGTVGTLEAIALPQTKSELAALTRRARATFRTRAPKHAGDNPLLMGPDGPIKHVIYITRENKTYDADLGDLHPGSPDNALTLFGRTVTPNLHELETQFIESDNFTYQGFASVVGHMWEDAGMVSDIYERAEASQTGTHFKHIDDTWHDPSNYPASGLITEQAHDAGLSVRTYNQETAQQAHLLPDAVQAPTSVYPNYDLHVPDVKREAGWEQEFKQFAAHDCTGALADTYGSDCSLPDLEYVYLGEDHTTVVDEPGYPTIEAQVADNDLATARVIDSVSHSPYWRSTLGSSAATSRTPRTTSPRSSARSTASSACRRSPTLPRRAGRSTTSSPPRPTSRRSRPTARVSRSTRSRRCPARPRCPTCATA